MNWLLTTFQNAKLSKSTTYGGLIFIVAKYGGAIAMHRFPDYSGQIKDFADALEGFAVLYLGANARSEGSSKQTVADFQSQLNELRKAAVTGDTTHLRKEDVPPTKTA